MTNDQHLPVIGEPAPGGSVGEPSRAEPVWCRLLRTKSYFGTVGSGDEGWFEGDSTLAGYWCLKTMEPCGPDDGLVHPHECVSSRACFRPPLE